MDLWFKKNIKLTLKEQWESITKLPYPYLNTSGMPSIGFIAVYDPYYERYILHKKDYELDAEFLANFHEDTGSGYIEGDYYWNSTGIYLHLLGVLYPVDFERLVNVINKSFTISYSLEKKAWISYHSYRPNHAYNNNLSFFTTVNNTDFSTYSWKHGIRNFQSYYGVKQDFILEYVSKGDEPVLAKSFDNIEVMGNVYAYDGLNDYWYEIYHNTFDRLLAYNNSQSTGLETVQVKNTNAYFDVYNNAYSTRIVSVHRDRNIWKINNLRDYGRNVLGGTNAIMTNRWTLADYSNVFRTRPNLGYIDRVSNPDFLNLTKSVYEIQRFNERFLNVRLFYKPAEDYKIVITLTANLKRMLV